MKIITLLGAFQLTTPAPGETHTASAAISAEGVSAAAGYGEGSTDNTDVRAFFTILVFDKNFNLIDTKYQQVTNDSNWDLIDLTYTAQEECHIYTYISMEDGSLSDLYIDDVTITHTPSKVIQYNEYYPFGMQTDRSWTRDTGMANNFLSNGGTELNPASQLYDLGFRNLDPVLGRFHQVDPMADKYGSQNPYHYASNNPANLNDVSGLDPEGSWGGPWLFKLNQARQLMSDWNGGGGSGGYDDPMTDNPDAIQNVMNSYDDYTPSSMNVFNSFQPNFAQMVNDAFNRTPAGTNAYYSGNGTLLQSGYSGSITLQGGGPVIYNEYVNDYVPAYLITLNGGVNTNKELYERALRAISDFRGAPDPDDVNAKYGLSFYALYQSYPNIGRPEDGSNLEQANYIINRMMDKHADLEDIETPLAYRDRNMRALAYLLMIIPNDGSHSTTFEGYFIKESQWNIKENWYPNPGKLTSDVSARPVVIDTGLGRIEYTVWFEKYPPQ